MTIWKTDRSSAPLFTPNAPAQWLDWAALVVIVAALGLVLLWLLPLPLVLPVPGLISFMVAAVVALWSHYSGIDRRAPCVSAWDIAAVFTLIWIGAGLMSGTKQFAELFDRLATIP